MSHKFIYKEKFSLSYCYPAIAFIILSIGAGIFQFGISIKNLRLLVYPNSMYIMIVCAVIFSAYAYIKYSKAKKSTNNPNPIEISETSLSFPKGENEKISTELVAIQKLDADHDEDTGKQIIMYTNNGSYTFIEDNFENTGEFTRFESLLKEYYAKAK